VSERKKIQFWLHPDDAADLENLVEKTRQGSLSDVLRNALTLYAWAADEVGKGGRLQLVATDGERSTIVLPGLK
jgi:hypothetical protein